MTQVTLWLTTGMVAIMPGVTTTRQFWTAEGLASVGFLILALVVRYLEKGRSE
jgi:hypothetical protein